MRGTFGALAMCALFALPLSAADRPAASTPVSAPAHQVTALAAAAPIPAAADAAFLALLGAPALACRDICQVNSDCNPFCGAPGGICVHNPRPRCNGCACP